MIIHYNCTIGSFLLHSFLLIYHPYPPSFHEMIFTLVYIVATAPTDLMVRQISPTSIRVTWTPPTPLGDTTGYIIYYTSKDITDSVDVSGGFTDEYTLMNLEREADYTISIVAVSEHLPIEPLTESITLVPCKT